MASFRCRAGSISDSPIGSSAAPTISFRPHAACPATPLLNLSLQSVCLTIGIFSAFKRPCSNHIRLGSFHFRRHRYLYGPSLASSLHFSWNETLTLSQVMDIPGHFSLVATPVCSFKSTVPINQRYQAASRYHHIQHLGHSCSHLWWSLPPTAPDLSH
jgi:hypothetical protein